MALTLRLTENEIQELHEISTILGSASSSKTIKVLINSYAELVKSKDMWRKSSDSWMEEFRILAEAVQLQREAQAHMDRVFNQIGTLPRDNTPI